MQAIQTFFPKETQKIFFIGSHIGLWSLAKLQFSLGQFPYLFPPTINSGTFPIKVALREKLKASNAEHPFELILQKLIPELMPTVYLEGFSKIKQEAKDKFPKTTKVILTAHSFYVEEGFKFWAANQTDNGAKLLLLQHGGVYGSAGWSQSENIELDVCDKFYTWGWKDNNPKIIPMKSWHLAKKINKVKPDPNGSILVVGLGNPRYCDSTNPHPNGPQLLDYIREQELFVESVSQPIRELLLMKLFVVDGGWKRKERWRDFSPHLNIYCGKKNTLSLLNKSRLCIQTYNSTGYLETFALNFPTILYWNPNHSELRNSAKSYFDELRHAEILHDNPESAAAKVNEIYRDPLFWWMTPKIQKVKDDFCRQFAWTTRTWQSDWIKELLKRADD